MNNENETRYQRIAREQRERQVAREKRQELAFKAQQKALRQQRRWARQAKHESYVTFAEYDNHRPNADNIGDYL